MFYSMYLSEIGRIWKQDQKGAELQEDEHGQRPCYITAPNREEEQVSFGPSGGSAEATPGEC